MHTQSWVGALVGNHGIHLTKVELSTLHVSRCPLEILLFLKLQFCAYHLDVNPIELSGNSYMFIWGNVAHKKSTHETLFRLSEL